MSASQLSNDGSLPSSLADRLDPLCNAFEAAWRSGERPGIEGYLIRAAQEERPALFRELLATELAYRGRAGEGPSPEEYRQRFPQYAGCIEAAFADGLGTAPQEASTARTPQSAQPDLLPTRPGGDPPGESGGLPCVPGHELLAVLGRGGMGVVYKARHLKLNRLVALKMIRGGQFDSPQALLRFQGEAELTAHLDHPNIVPIYDVGQHDGRHYFSMKLIEAGSLARHLGRFAHDQRAAARLVATVARAVHHAHQRGLLHRDLKPANVLLDLKDEPHVTDFGLAKKIEGDVGLTQSGVPVGTPAYMAPEQAQAQKVLTTAADVYGLGAILYELLVGRPPFRAASVLETLRQVVEAEPVPPRAADARVDRDLEIICLKCLRKAPDRRYGSAEALAEDLERWLKGEPIQARSVGAWERGIKWVRRNRTAAALVGLVALLASATAVGWWWDDARVKETREESRAVTLVQAIASAETTDVAKLVAELGPYRQRADPVLRKLAEESAPDSKERLHAALALVRADPGQVGYLCERLLAPPCRPQELLVIREALLPYKEQLCGKLWHIAEEPEAGRGQRFRAACALAAFQPEDPRWAEVSSDVVATLVTEDTLSLAHWTGILRPARGALREPLRHVFADKDRAVERAIATNILADYAADQPDLLAELLKDADEHQFGALRAVLQAHRERVIALMEQELGKEAPPAREVRAQDLLAKRQANAAVALVQLGQAETAWPLLRHGPDPSRRTYLLHELGRLGTPPEVLLRRLEAETEVSARRALILSLGELTGEQLPAERRQTLVALLLQWYRDDPDPGIHSAVDWLLRYGRQGKAARKFDWQQGQALSRIDRELAGQPPGERSWYVSREGHTLAVVRGPVEFLMGSPDHEPDRIAPNETAHRKGIRRSFAIGTKEVTVAQFRRFLEANPAIKSQRADLDDVIQQFSPDDNGPIISVTWYEAAQYCNWLSKQEGIPETQWCYPAIDKIGDGMALPPDLLQRTGYRLPTEAEWEYACRAGASTSRFFGSSEALLKEYAWYDATTASKRAWPVGQLKPNDLGLFDVYGNVLEWCQDRPLQYEPGENGAANDMEDPTPTVVNENPRGLRGGAFNDKGYELRSACRNHDQPAQRLYNVGLRVARTYP